MPAERSDFLGWELLLRCSGCGGVGGDAELVAWCCCCRDLLPGDGVPLDIRRSDSVGMPAAASLQNRSRSSGNSQPPWNSAISRCDSANSSTQPDVSLLSARQQRLPSTQR